jgi:hypothetical protein
MSLRRAGLTWVKKVAPKLSEFIRIDKTRLSEDVHKQGLVLGSVRQPHSPG